jgi:23S rRNA (uracil1939-C5)-methyltransferase
MVEPGSLLTLTAEKPVAGGRMLARHDGMVVLVWGAIPGELITARVDRVSKQLAYASTVEVLTPSADRLGSGGDWWCGGQVYAHIAYPRQLELKRAVVLDALNRIARVAQPPDLAMTASPEKGYRMRARLHVKGTRVGFFRGETHDVCDAASTGQLLPGAEAVITWCQRALRAGAIRGATSLEIAENRDASERVCHFELDPGADIDSLRALAVEADVTGVVATRAGRYDTVVGVSSVTDVVRVSDDESVQGVCLSRDPRAFFQGNRYLLSPMVRHVLSVVPPGPTIDLYAGVGLFGLCIAAAGSDRVTLVEDDPISGEDLQRNAASFGDTVTVCREPVEAFVRRVSLGGDVTVVIDPPRTGLSRAAADGLLSRRPARLVYVSCDPATFARDTGLLTAGGYRLVGLHGFDLFPKTAHIEIVAILEPGGALGPLAHGTRRVGGTGSD